jgi:hypothetical protein
LNAIYPQEACFLIESEVYKAALLLVIHQHPIGNRLHLQSPEHYTTMSFNGTYNIKLVSGSPTGNSAIYNSNDNGVALTAFNASDDKQKVRHILLVFFPRFSSIITVVHQAGL